MSQPTPAFTRRRYRNIENSSKPARPETIRLIADLLRVPVKAITRDGTDDGIAGSVPDEPEDVAAQRRLSK